MLAQRARRHRHGGPRRPHPARQPGRRGSCCGVRADEIRGRDAIETLIDPADRELARGWVDRLTAGEPVPTGVLARLMRGDGSRFSAEVSVSPIRDAAGAVIGMVGTLRDVTARLAAEEDAATLRAIVDAATEAIVGVDRQGDILFFSPSAERLYGWQAEEVIGKPVTVLIAEHQLDLAAGGGRGAGRGQDRAPRGRRAAPRRLAPRGRAQRQPDHGRRRPGPRHGADRARHLRAPPRAAHARPHRRARADVDRGQGPRGPLPALRRARGGRDRPPLGGHRRAHRPRGVRAQHRRPARRAGQARARLGRPADLRGDAARARRAGLRLHHHPLPAARAGRQDRGARPDRRRRLGDPARRDRPRAAGRARAGRPGRDHRARPRRPDHDLEPGRGGDVRPARPSRRSAAATTSCSCPPRSASAFNG